MQPCLARKPISEIILFEEIFEMISPFGFVHGVSNKFSIFVVHKEEGPADTRECDRMRFHELKFLISELGDPPLFEYFDHQVPIGPIHRPLAPRTDLGGEEEFPVILRVDGIPLFRDVCDLSLGIADERLRCRFEPMNFIWLFHIQALLYPVDEICLFLFRHFQYLQDAIGGFYLHRL